MRIIKDLKTSDILVVSCILWLASVLMIAMTGAILVNRLASTYKQANIRHLNYYDVVKTCQAISGTNTNPNWKYQGCIDEMSKSIQPQAIILKS